ncbi:MAG: PQQ-like beta-propeller repeat protein [Fimbriiglobus sp.]|nr:PQQ-like beta-propeller repeat protein [Fimbriiglobus sp.]
MLPRSVAFSLLTFCLMLPRIRADDWPQWLGPNRDGQWKEAGVVDKLPKELKPLWTAKIGQGYTGPAVAQGKVVLMDRVTDTPTAEGGALTTSKGKERVVCLDADTGKEVWVHDYDCEYKRISYGSGPRTTPVIAGDVLYTLGAMGDLKCLTLKDGKPVWAKNFPIDFKAPTPAWGWSAHLLVEGDLIIALVGGENQAVMAFDKKTGEKKWAALSTKEICYSAPVIAEAGGKRQLLVWLSEYVASLNPATGEEYWRHEHPAKGTNVMRPAVSIIMPKVAGDRVYVSGGYHGALALKLGQDQPTADVLWRETKGVQQSPSKLSTLMTSLLVHDGHLYGQCREGELKCLKAETGEVLWDDHSLLGGKPAQFGSASWVQNGEKVWCLTDQGDLVTLTLSPKGYNETSRAHLIDPTQAAGGRKVTWAHPAFAGKRVYARNDKQVVCVSLAKE